LPAPGVGKVATVVTLPPALTLEILPVLPPL
jgi:hypothetical protein